MLILSKGYNKKEKILLRYFYRYLQVQLDFYRYFCSRKLNTIIYE